MINFLVQKKPANLIKHLTDAYMLFKKNYVPGFEKENADCEMICYSLILDYFVQDHLNDIYEVSLWIEWCRVKQMPEVIQVKKENFCPLRTYEPFPTNAIARLHSDEASLRNPLGSWCLALNAIYFFGLLQSTLELLFKFCKVCSFWLQIEEIVGKIPFIQMYSDRWKLFERI